MLTKPKHLYLNYLLSKRTVNATIRFIVISSANKRTKNPWRHRQHLVSKPMIRNRSFKHKIVFLLERCKHLREFNQVHAHIITQPDLSPHDLSFHISKLASCCAGSHPSQGTTALAYAIAIFNQLENPPISLWNSIIRGLSLSNNPLEAIVFYHKLIEVSDLIPNRYTYPFLLRACTRANNPIYGLMTHAHVVKFGLELDPHCQSSLIHFYAHGRDLAGAQQVFEMSSNDDAVSWNSMIDGCVKCGDVMLARRIFDIMVCRDVISWNTIINGYCGEGNVEEAHKLFDEMPQKNVVTWNSMLAGYAKCGRMDDVENWFRNMPHRDHVSWNTMIAAYEQCGRPSEAWALFGEMQVAGTKPTETTFVSVLSACAQSGLLDEGVRIHALINEHKVEVNSILSTALIDMYAKNGKISTAVQIFNSMDSRDILSWNTMIAGLAINGRGKEAIELFQQMVKEGLQPNDMTFVLLLSACSHAGMVEEGQKLLTSMRCAYGIDPKIEHYGSVIDLLARSGHLEKAIDIVLSMPVKPNASIWGAILGGCRIHANSEVGRRVGRYLINMQPHHSGRYALLSNIYSAAGQWSNASEIQNLMKSKRVEKAPGLSMVKPMDSFDQLTCVITHTSS